jgi:uncharacterized protein YndB with AHSA1/START domain
MNDLSLTCRRLIQASPERVYQAWLDPKSMAAFMAPGPTMHVSQARADAKVGGRFFVMMVGDKDYPHEGTYLELVPFSRIVFTWEAPWSAPGTQVEIDLTPKAGGTDVTLTQVKFMTEQNRDSHLEGWTAILGKLETLLAGAKVRG